MIIKISNISIFAIVAVWQYGCSCKMLICTKMTLKCVSMCVTLVQSSNRRYSSHRN